MGVQGLFTKYFKISLVEWVRQDPLYCFSLTANLELPVDQGLRQALSHVLWIGGATDTGKTTISRLVAERRSLQVYHYDRYDRPQIDRLAQTSPRYRAFLDASLEERWIVPEPQDLLGFLLQSFQDRFPLVIESLLDLPKQPMIVAEGFGFTPELVFPLLSSACQAIWLVPTEDFKRASMERRNKPSFKDQVSDPARAKRNLFERDMLLARLIRAQAETRGLVVYEVDGARPVADMASRVETHFEPFLDQCEMG